MAKKNKRRQQEFLLTFFDKEPNYQIKEVNGFTLVKNFNGNSKIWQVSIFTKESFKNYNMQKSLL